jgi:membrane protease YdiL (CAAX protease family)
MVTYYRQPFSKFLAFKPIYGVYLIAIFSIARIFLVLNASKTGNYQWVSLIFLAMILYAVILLTGEGRKLIGWRRIGGRALMLSAVSGAVCAAITGVIGWLLYNGNQENWFVYISQSYTNLPDLQEGNNRLIYYLIYSSIGITFSPFGEELFYRGIVHESFRKWGESKASMIDALAFSLVHLAHFGIIWTGSRWAFLALPALIWVILLFGTCLVFSYCRRKTGSIWASVGAHAAFNVVMNAFIFFLIL